MHIPGNFHIKRPGMLVGRTSEEETRSCFVGVPLIFFFTLNPLTPGAFCKKNHFLDILAVFRLDFGQIATRQLAVLAISIAIYDILARACAEIKSFWRRK